MSGACIINGPAGLCLPLVAALEARGEAVIHIEANGDAEWEAAAAEASARHGGIARVLNLLVNPAPEAVLGSLSPAEFERVYAATVGVAYAGMRATVLPMREAGGGRFLTIWVQDDPSEANGMIEPVCLGGLEMCSRVIAKEYAEAPTVNVNFVFCRAGQAEPESLMFWADYLGGEPGCYVTGANIGRPAH